MFETCAFFLVDIIQILFMVLMQYNEIAYCVFSEMRYNNIVIRKNRKMLAAPSEDGLKEAHYHD